MNQQSQPLFATKVVPFQPVLPLLDLTNVRHRVMKDHPDWTSERLEIAIQDYREFMALAKAMRGYKLVPTRDADQVWHAHLLHTRDYARFCMDYAGFFIHHSPKLPGEDAAHDEEELKTMRLHEQFFGKPHPVMVGVRQCSSSCTDDTPGK
ncbi:glycine-rich domain-containing protein-like [Candidatus Parcubacteria bacterium]|nr:glycine-rich domain-containing protein-like [Candidatus Parcubacteria bacterium]